MVQALFPRKKALDDEYDFLYRITLSIGFSIVLVIFLGFFLAHPSVRLWKEPFISITFLTVSLIFFVVGWYQGAYPFLGVLVPELARSPSGMRTPLDEFTDSKTITTTLVELKGLAMERRQLTDKVRKMERKERINSPALTAYYRKQKEKYLEELKVLNERIGELEVKRMEEQRL